MIEADAMNEGSPNLPDPKMICGIIENKQANTPAQTPIVNHLGRWPLPAMYPQGIEKNIETKSFPVLIKPEKKIDLYANQIKCNQM